MRGLVKIAYADLGTRDGLLANLAALIDDETANLRFAISPVLKASARTGGQSMNAAYFPIHFYTGGCWR